MSEALQLFPLPPRITAKIDRRGPDECWPWLAYRSEDGYGITFFDGKLKKAHRVTYEAAKGAIPEGLTIDHLCRNRACVNPAHLEAVTQRENNLRGETGPGVNARKTHCPKGHPYDEKNTEWYRGHRYCWACRHPKRSAA